MDFASRLPDGVVLVDAVPTVEFLLINGNAAPTPPTTSDFVLDAAKKVWQFKVVGGVNGTDYVVRVKAMRSDNIPIEGDGVLQVRIPGVAT